MKLRDWDKLPDEQILQIRVRDLGLKINGTWLEPLIQRLYNELDAKGISFRPPCYLADEWLCPDKMPIIGIPFYLAHPRLIELEQKMMYEVEGGTEAHCMKLLRHECGHAINYAYELYKRTRWRQLFGPFSARYSNSYYPRPYSKRYVVHLEDNYAQAHPDEDFAETFAVWLTPGIDWQQKYSGWPVMSKLRYVDRLMKKMSDQQPVKTVQERPPWSAARMVSTLAAYYDRKRRTLGSDFQGYYDERLKKLFTAKPGSDSAVKASRLVRRHRRELARIVTMWTGHRKYDIYQLLNRFVTRCDALGLYARDSDLMGLAALLTAIGSNTLRIPKEHKRL